MRKDVKINFMKKIEAVIYHFELIELREALSNLGIEEITVSEVKGINTLENDKKEHRRGEYIADFISKIKIEIAAESDKAEAVRKAIENVINLNDVGNLISSQCEFYESENIDDEENNMSGNITTAALSSGRSTLPINGVQGNPAFRKENIQKETPIVKKYGVQEPFAMKSAQSPLALKKKADDNSLNFIWKVTKTSEPDIRAVTVISKNCPGIFSKIAGVFTLNGLDIVHARSYRQNDNTLDIFKVSAFPGSLMNESAIVNAESNLKASLSGRLDLSGEFRKKMASYCHRLVQVRDLNQHRKISVNPHVTVNNDNSLLFSIIEVSADDFPGLLFSITDAIFRCGLKVWMSKISTKGNRVTDIFYVKDAEERKAESPLRVANIRASILEAISLGENLPIRN